MKVTHLIWSLKVGGSETMLVDIANEQSMSAEVTIVIGNAVLDNTVLDGLGNSVQVRCIERRPGSRNPWHLLKLIHTLRKLSPDIVHAHQESFVKVTSLLSVPTVFTIHDTKVKLQFVEKHDAVYAISEAVRTDLLARYPVSSPTVIHNGICFSKIPQKTCYGQLPFRIVQVSRLYHDKKGQDILLRAFQEVSKVIGVGRVLVDFIGEGPSREYLGALAEQLGVAQSCRFLGQHPRTWIYKNLHTYDLLVQPSRYEGFGLTVVEAMSARVPVLVSNIEGPMEIIAAGRHGYYFRAGDHLDCAAKIIDVVKESQGDTFPDALDSTIEYVRNQFDIADTARKYLAEYKKIIGKAHAA